MEAAGETCKLCLKYIQGANLAILDETLLGKLEFLQMDLDQSVEESNSVCKECEEKIENAFDFKSCLVNTESCLVPYVSEDKTQKVNLRVIVEKDSPSTSAGESSAEKEVCRLCKNFVDAIAVISLPKILKDDSMMEVFQGHIPEMDLDVTENPVVCESCQKSLASFSTLIASWSIANGWNDDDDDMKEDFNDFEMVQVKKESYDELSDSNTNSSTGIVDISGSAKTGKKAKSKNGQSDKIKTESEDLSDSSESVAKKFKSEDAEEDTGTDDLQLKNEEVDIKDEDGWNTKSIGNIGRVIQERNTREFIETTTLTDTFQCDFCPYFSKKWKYLRCHVLRNHTSSTTIFTCPQCPYQTKYKSNLNKHSLVHKSIDEIITFQCNLCPYKAKEPLRLKRHSMIHQSIDELKMFKCDKCPYQSKFKGSLQFHVLSQHKSCDEVEMHKCEKCPYQSKIKYSLTKHLLIHKSKDEVVMHKCDKCPYETKVKCSLKTHGLLHKSEDEVVMYKCSKCSYQAKVPGYLRIHSKTHKSAEEMVSYRCKRCSFRTKYKQNISRHIESHPDDRDAFKTPESQYTTTIIKQRRMKPVKQHKCEKCSFETRYVASLQRHIKRHEKA